jgi:acyl carrier protein
VNRMTRGLPSLSIAWGSWASGMAQSNAAIRQRQRRGPVLEMDAALAINAFSHAVAGRDHHLAVMDVDWTRYAGTTSPLLRDLPDVPQQAADADAGEAARDGLARELAGAPRARQVQVLTDLIRTAAAAVLGHASAGEIEAGRAFGDLGFDSLTSLEMRQQLAGATGLRLPATLLFDYPTPAHLAEHLWTEAFGNAESSRQPVLDELDRLAALLSSITRNDDGRSEIAARLEAITQEFRTEPAEDPEEEYQLQVATNDEMFDIVEQVLNDSEFD